jgi:TPR repeat protein
MSNPSAERSARIDMLLGRAFRLASGGPDALRPDELVVLRQLLESTPESDRAVRRVEKALDLFATDGDAEFAIDAIRSSLPQAANPAQPANARPIPEPVAPPPPPSAAAACPASPAEPAGAAIDTDTPIDQLRALADQNNAEAVRLLGLLYLNGLQVEKNLETAVACFRRAIDLGSSRAKLNLGKRLLAGEGVTPDPQRGLQLMRESANAGDTAAIYEVGEVYYHGRGGIAEDAHEAVRWYRRGAESGHAASQWSLGVCLEDGFGVEADESAAVGWYRKAAEGGSSDAMVSLGHCLSEGRGVRQDPVEAAKWYLRAAEQGEVVAMREYGLALCRGVGVEQDEEQGYEWLERAADEGDEIAQYEFGTALHEGIVYEVDQEAAVALFRKAAEQGHVEATRKLAWAYSLGHGVEADLARAAEYFGKAAEAGDLEAMVEYARALREGDGIDADTDEAMRWLERAAEEKFDAAYAALGVCYLTGDGADEDEERAVEYFELAADRDGEAAWRLGDCHRFGWGVAEDAKAAFAWYSHAVSLEDHAEAKARIAECLYFGQGVPQDRPKAFALLRDLESDPRVFMTQDSVLGLLGLCHCNGEGTPVDLATAERLLERAAKGEPDRWTEAFQEVRAKRQPAPQGRDFSVPRVAKRTRAVGGDGVGTEPSPGVAGDDPRFKRAFGKGGEFDRLFGPRTDRLDGPQR